MSKKKIVTGLSGVEAQTLIKKHGFKVSISTREVTITIGIVSTTFEGNNRWSDAITFMKRWDKNLEIPLI